MKIHSTAPLAERMRPSSLDMLVGQEHLIGDGGILHKAITRKVVTSMILWGPPGVGKTTLANLIASAVEKPMYTLSAVHAGVKNIREIIEKATRSGSCIVFIDEIHRFNKTQQDALLGAVEQGIITLIGATTENPSFEVNSALLSRCQVYILTPLRDDHLLQLVEHALKNDTQLRKRKVIVKEKKALLTIAGGDARKVLNTIDLLAETIQGDIVITDRLVMDVVQKRISVYDKNGEQHYDVISAFIKSIRGSDPNAATYYLARMVEGGEDVKFIARRMVVLASEDIGNANPNALVLATSTFQAVHLIGYPEAQIILSQCAVYLASSPKSNASYTAIKKARKKVMETGDLPVPLALRNTPTQLMNDLNYGKGYAYAHDSEGNFADMEFLPDKIKDTQFYNPGENPRERELRAYLKKLWGKKYNY